MNSAVGATQLQCARFGAPLEGWRVTLPRENRRLWRLKGTGAMVFDNGDGTKVCVGMNSPAFDWHNFVFNAIDWRTGSEINSNGNK